jgi:hypothetical protein
MLYALRCATRLCQDPGIPGSFPEIHAKPGRFLKNPDPIRKNRVGLVK